MSICSHGFCPRWRRPICAFLSNTGHAPAVRWGALLVLLCLLALPAAPATALAIMPTGPTEILSAGGYHTCALTPTGAVDCWGWNQFGEAADRPGPYVQISAGSSHTCALTPSGAIECWGANNLGQADSHAGPYLRVSAGDYHTCALTPAGAVECWGKDDKGQVGGAHPGPYTQVSTSAEHTCALTTAGAVECWGDDEFGQVGGAHPGPYVEVSAGVYHTCARTALLGTLECWGDNSYGQSATTVGYLQVTAGAYHTCALFLSTYTRGVDCQGDDGFGQVGGDSGRHFGAYSQISAGYYHTCALRTDGAIRCWGNNQHQQVGGDNGLHAGPYGPYTPYAGPSLPPLVSAGYDHSCALTPAGVVECWGDSFYTGTVSGVYPGPYTRVSSGVVHACAQTPEGAIHCWGVNDDGQGGNLPGPYRQVSPGNYHTCALTPSGAAECWGDNEVGQADFHPGPYISVDAGGSHTCALTPGGAVECWGSNVEGQAEARPGPYVQVSAGDEHTCALTAAGAVECWGWDDSGQVGGAHPGPYVQVSAGIYHTCALTPAGAVECWGWDDSGQVGGAHPGPYLQVSAGFLHTCALTAAGAVECWGDDHYGQLGGAPPGPNGPNDPTGPETNHPAAPPAQPSANDPSFSFTSPTATAFQCRLDGSAWATCTSPHSMTDLADGPHTFEVRAVSPLGTPDTSPAAHVWTIDTTPPNTGLTDRPDDLMASSDAAFSFISTETGSTFQCRLDGGAWTACASPQRYSGLSDGAHTFAVFASDAAGNADPTPANDAWRIDSAGPTTTITAAPPNPSPSAEALFAFTAPAGATFECRLDGGAWAACVSPQSYGGLSDGSHTFAVRATNAAGVTGPVADHTWTIALSPPIGALYVTAGGGTVSGGPAYQKNDILKWDGGAWSVWFDGAGKMPPSVDIISFDVDDDSAGTAWMSFRPKNLRLPGLVKVQPQDVVYWNGSAFALFFDGSDVGLTLSGENINGLEVLPGSVSPIGVNCRYYLLISTNAGGLVRNGAEPQIRFTGEDVLGFCMTQSGPTTTGLWHVALEGESEGLPKNSTLGLSASADAATLYFIVRSAMTLDGHALRPSQVFSFSGGVFSAPLWKAADHGLMQPVDGIDFGN